MHLKNKTDFLNVRVEEKNLENHIVHGSPGLFFPFSFTHEGMPESNVLHHRPLNISI